MLCRFLPTLSFTYLPTKKIAGAVLFGRQNPSHLFLHRSCIHNPPTSFQNLLFPYRRATSSHSPIFFTSKILQRLLFYSVTTLLASATVITTAEASGDHPMNDNINLTQSAHAYQIGSQSKELLTFPPDALQYDTYQGISINVSRLPSHFFEKKISTTQSNNKNKDNHKDEEEEEEENLTLFEKTLQQSLLQWKDQKYRGIWLHIPTHLSPIILPFCIQKLHFDFRHAHPGTVILTTWLPDSLEQPNKLPLGPTHQVGVGAIIIHPKEKNKILVVQEKSGPASIHQLWKMPTGLTDPGEDIPQALVREVYEETSFKVQFQQIICFRQAHSSGRSSGGSMGQSDLFFVCLATFANDDSHNNKNNDDDEILKDFIKEQHDEIANIQWMDVDEYANQKIWKLSPLYKEMNDAVRRCVYHYYYYSHSSSTKEEDDKIHKDSSDLSVGRIQDEMDKEDHDSTRKDDVTVEDPYGFIAKTLPIGFRPGVNTIYISKL